MPVSRTQNREEDGKTKSLGALLPVEIYIAVDAVDGAGEKANHVVFRARGTKQFYRLLPKGAENMMAPLQGWLNKLIDDKVVKLNASNPPTSGGEEEVASPSDMGETIPTGSI